jgi:hypothetical protein
MEDNIDDICKRFHRSAFSHFERVQPNMSGIEQQTLLQTQQPKKAVPCAKQEELRQYIRQCCSWLLIQDLLHRRVILNRLKRRQRTERYKRRRTLALLNQVAFKLSKVGKFRANRNKRQLKPEIQRCEKKDNTKRIERPERKISYEELAYLGDASTVSTYQVNQLQGISSCSALRCTDPFSKALNDLRSSSCLIGDMQ